MAGFPELLPDDARGTMCLWEPWASVGPASVDDDVGSASVMLQAASPRSLEKDDCANCGADNGPVSLEGTCMVQNRGLGLDRMSWVCSGPEELAIKWDSGGRRGHPTSIILS